MWVDGVRVNQVMVSMNCRQRRLRSIDDDLHRPAAAASAGRLYISANDLRHTAAGSTGSTRSLPTSASGRHDATSGSILKKRSDANARLHQTSSSSSSSSATVVSPVQVYTLWKKCPHIHGQSTASFPYFNGTRFCRRLYPWIDGIMKHGPTLRCQCLYGYFLQCRLSTTSSVVVGPSPHLWRQNCSEGTSTLDRDDIAWIGL